MTSAKLLSKYFWFLRAFMAGPITREELELRWLRSPLNNEHSRIPKSTFYHMKNEIEVLFDVSIACSKKGEYYIEETFKQSDEFRQWMLSSLAIDTSLEDMQDVHARIMFEKIPGGTQFLQPMVDAMQSNYRVILRYGSFKHEPKEFIFSPYALRVYKQRWYVIGESSDHPNETRVYAFDRIMQLSTTNQHFKVPEGFDVKKFFANYYGVTVGETSDVLDIVVRIQKKGVPYLRTLPLHPSQQEINTTDEYSDFQFHLAPNFEFCQEILSRGDEAEVLSPQSLRDHFAKIIANLQQKYTK